MSNTTMTDVNSEFIIDLTENIKYLIEILERICPEKKDEVIIEYMKKVVENYELSEEDAENILHDLGIIFLVDEMVLD
jgi:predicted CopG family antitoxin